MPGDVRLVRAGLTKIRGGSRSSCQLMGDRQGITTGIGAGYFQDRDPRQGLSRDIYAIAVERDHPLAQQIS